MRLWEAEAALDLKMPLGEWYDLPLIEREQIVATRIAKVLIEGLVTKDAVERAKRGK